MLTQSQFLQPLAARRTDQVVVSTMSLVRAWGRLSKHELDFAFADSAMGHAQSLALGIALAQPARRVLCLNGDGSMLMSLGSLVTIAQSRARNLILFVAQNNTYEVTGNQEIPGAGAVDFHSIALACGFPYAFSFTEPEAYQAQLDNLLHLQGPVFISIRLEPGAGAVNFHSIALACGFPYAFSFTEPEAYQAQLDNLLHLQGPVFISVRLEPGAEPPPNRKQTEDTPYLRGSLADAAHRLREAMHAQS